MLQTPRTSKWMRAGFYAFIGYTAISTTLAWTTQLGIIQVDRQADANQAVEKARGDESESSARAFAANVAREYLLWNQGQEDSRKERLEPYLHPDLDVQAGLDLKKVEWNSWAREVEVWEIQKQDNQFIAWVYAQTTMTKGKKQKRVDRWMKIPMEKAGASYLVTDTPYFTAPPEAELPKEKDDDEKEWGERADREIRADVETFLNSFWKTYTTGNPEEIGYMLQGDQTAKGLTGIASFIEMDHLEVFENKGNFLAQVDVRFQDLASQAEVTYPYSLYLSREGTRWYVVRVETNR